MIQEYLIANTTEDALNKKRSNAKSIFYAGGTEINRCLLYTSPSPRD